jgi:hypothetical protein
MSRLSLGKAQRPFDADELACGCAPKTMHLQPVEVSPNSVWACPTDNLHRLGKPTAVLLGYTITDTNLNLLESLDFTITGIFSKY